MTRYDAIVIGGGHNGLVAAAYLARAGRRTRGGPAGRPLPPPPGGDPRGRGAGELPRPQPPRLPLGPKRVVELAQGLLDALAQRAGPGGRRAQGPLHQNDFVMGELVVPPLRREAGEETLLSDLKNSPFQPDYVFANLGRVADWLLEHR